MQGPSRRRPRNPALDELRDALNDDQAVERFVTDFLALLDARVSALGALLEAGAFADCTVVLMTLETSGRMVGALQLAEVVANFRQAVLVEDKLSDTLFRDLVAASRDARHALTAE